MRIPQQITRLHARVAELEAELARERQDNKSNLELVVQVETLRARVAELVEALEAVESEIIVVGGHLQEIVSNALRPPPATETKGELPSVNWNDGKPYSYCPECGRREPIIK